MKTFILTILLASLPVTSNAQIYYPYLDDADKTVTPALPAAFAKYDHAWPRVSLTETKSLDMTDEQVAKFNVLSGKAQIMVPCKRVKVLNPSLLIFRAMSPRSYQGFNEPFGGQASGMPFTGTGPATYHVTGTTDAKVYAGHWLYKPGTATTAAMTASATTVPVADTTKVTMGQYVVIYDAPAGSFANAEHALVTGINSTTKVVTLTRGYLSSQYAHPTGAIVAHHVIGKPNVSGEIPDPRLWTYNQSTYCPKDANGKTLGQVMADWIPVNLTRTETGEFVDVEVDGVLFDADKFEFTDIADVNNDLIQDNGKINGVNTWGQGLKSFHALVRSKMPGKFIVGGVATTRSFESLSGTQMEEWPTLFRGALPNIFDSALADYGFRLHHHASPLHTHAMSRLQTLTYPFGTGTAQTDNKQFRFGFATAMLDNGYYGKENSKEYDDPWYDEYAVDVVAGSPTFGTALNALDPNILAHRGWMGRPLGTWKRIYDDVAFAPAKTLVANGGFEVDLTDWAGTNVTIARDTTAGNFLEGTAAMKLSLIKTGGTVTGPTLSLLANTDYTLAFATRAASIRPLTVSLGTSTQQIFVPTKWVRRVIKLRTTVAGNYNINFTVGGETPSVWIDSVYLFRGNANVFSREFTKALVVVNATSSTKTVSLGKTYKRIKGTQDPINNGASVSSVTIGAWDAAILIKP